MNPIRRLFRKEDSGNALATRDEADRINDWIEGMPWVNLALSGIVAALSIVSDAVDVSSAVRPWLKAATIGMLLLLVATMVVWFVRAFTFSLEERNEAMRRIFRRQIFIFAYAFTFISFIVVTMPARDVFKVDDTQRTISPISMFYGCFYYGPNVVETPIPRCDRTLLGDRDAASDSLGESKRKTVPASGATGDDRQRFYTLLLALGGAAATPIERTGAGDQAGANRPSVEQQVYAVSGGLVLPLYVVLVAMIGGAISLSRRIPEIQKRADPTFPGTPLQTPLQLFEAREQVVFQIMQLISAPFIAICSFHILEPRGTASAVALAFASGFASESILLIIRGVVDGIRPGIPHTVASELAQLSGVVCDAQGAPVADAIVKLQADADRPGMPNEMHTGIDGKFLFCDVPKRRYVVQASKASLSGQEIVEVTSNAEHVVVVLKEAPVAARPAPTEAGRPG